MATFVLREGKIVLKPERTVPSKAASSLAAPYVQGFDAYPSPIDDKPITSHRQRERDLHRSGSYDKRDTPASFRKAQDARRRHNEQFASVTPRYS